MKALLKGTPPNYDEIIPEDEWGAWVRNNLNYYTDYYGYILVDDFPPIDSAV